MIPVTPDESSTCYICTDEIQAGTTVFGHPREFPVENAQITWLRSKIPHQLNRCLSWFIPPPSFSYTRWSDGRGIDHPVHVGCLYSQINGPTEHLRRMCGSCRAENIGLNREILELGDGTPEWQAKAEDDPQKIAWRTLVTRLDPSLADRTERVCQAIAHVFSIVTACLFCAFTITLYVKGLFLIGTHIGAEGFLRLFCDLTDVQPQLIILPFLPPFFLIQTSFWLQRRLYTVSLDALLKGCAASKNVSRDVRSSVANLRTRVSQDLSHLKQHLIVNIERFQHMVCLAVEPLRGHANQMLSSGKEYGSALTDLFARTFYAVRPL